MVYKFKDHSRSVDANTVGRYIEKLNERDGCVTSKSLLDSARDVNSEIHDCFEWDDAIAGERYRLKQAADILVNIVVISDENDSEEDSNNTIKRSPVIVRGFVNTCENKNGFAAARFEPIEKALGDSEKRKIVLKNALREFSIYERKYAYLSELADAFEAFNKLTNKWR